MKLPPMEKTVLASAKDVTNTLITKAEFDNATVVGVVKKAKKGSYKLFKFEIAPNVFESYWADLMEILAIANEVPACQLEVLKADGTVDPDKVEIDLSKLPLASYEGDSLEFAG